VPPHYEFEIPTSDEMWADLSERTEHRTVLERYLEAPATDLDTLYKIAAMKQRLMEVRDSISGLSDPRVPQNQMNIDKAREAQRRAVMRLTINPRRSS
jgi:hypothetical protein